jgi:hypothetical protein
LQFVTHFIIGINIGKVRRASRRLRACGEDIYLNTKTVTVIRRYSEKHATLSKPDHVGKQFQSRRFCCIICVSHIFAYSINGTQELSANWVLRRQIALCSVDGSLELSHCHVGKVFTNHIISQFVQTMEIRDADCLVSLIHVMQLKYELTMVHVTN